MNNKHIKTFEGFSQFSQDTPLEAGNFNTIEELEQKIKEFDGTNVNDADTASFFLRDMIVDETKYRYESNTRNYYSNNTTHSFNYINDNYILYISYDNLHNLAYFKDVKIIKES